MPETKLVPPNDATDLSTIVKSIPGMIYTYEVNHDTGVCNFPFVSDYCQEIFGVSAKAIMQDAETFVNLVHPDDAKDFTASVLESMINLTIWDFKMRMKTFDSRIVYVHGKSTPKRKEITNEDGSITKVTEWNGILFDITDRYKEDHGEVERKHDASHLLHVPCFTANTDGTILSWNKRMTQISQGIPKEAIVGTNLTSIIPDNIQAKIEVKEILNATRSKITNSTTSQNYLTILSNNQNEIHLKLRCEKDTDDDSIIIFTCEDVTKLKEAEKETRIALALLEAEKNLSEWLSHEIRNPLSVALEAANSLQEMDSICTCSTPCVTAVLKESKYNSELIQNAISYILDLLSKMLDLNKIVEGKMALRPTVCWLKKDILEPTVKMMHVKSNDISIRIQGKDLNMYVDKLRLKQVITNLISNSLKYTKKGCIEVKSYRTQKDFDGNDIVDSLAISVSDTGAGVPTTGRDKLFSKWEKLGSSVNGTGIGLCLCRFLVEQMGGIIYLDEEYESKVEGSPGAQFIMQFPIDTILASETDGTTIHKVPAFTALSSAVIASESKPDEGLDSSCVFANRTIDNDTCITGQYQILIVDDSKVVRKVTRKRVSQIFPEAIISEAISGEEAIDLALNQQYDLIFMDQYMGKGLHGDKTIEILRERDIDAYIIGVSGNDENKSHISGGADDFIQKPLPPQKVILQKLIPRLPPPSCWKALIVDPEEGHAHNMKRKLHMIATAHFTTAEAAERRISVNICTVMEDAVMFFQKEWYDVVVMCGELEDKELTRIALLAREQGVNQNAVIMLNSSKESVTESENVPFDILLVEQLFIEDDIRKFLLAKLVGSKVKNARQS